MRKKSDDGRSLLQLALQFRDKRKRLGIGVVEIEDNQRRLFFAVLLHALRQIFVILGELDLDVELARGFLDLGREEQIVNEGENARVGIFAQRGQRLGINRRKGCGETRTRTACALSVIAIPGQSGAVTVIHGSGVDAVLVVARLAGAGGACSPCIVGTAPATPSASPSATGGPSWSCVHNPLKAALPGI